MTSTTEFNGTVNFGDAAKATCLALAGDYINEAECSLYGGIAYTVRYNFTAMHVAPLYQTLADEAIVREALKDDGFKIRTTLHPLPLTKVEANLGKSEDAFSAWFLIVLSFPFISGSFATFVVAERQSKAKHLQTVAGVKPTAYWLSTWLWDVVNYQIPCWIVIILMFVFDLDVLTTTDNGTLGGVLALILLFGPASASFTYCFSFMFSSPSICNLLLIIGGFLVGLGGSMACFILRLIGANPASPKDSLVLAADITEWVLRFIPAFSLSKGLFNAINIQSFQFLEGEKISVWHERILLWEVIFMAWQSVVYLLLAMKIDEWSSNPRAVTIFRSITNILSCQFLCPVIYRDDAAEETPDDSDVLAEQERVLSGGANDDLIVLSQLAKVYDNGKRAVKNMSLGIPPGQCFGLLGINGAG
jgi:ATP-binding cassette, subfamily A (ABC1), member 3